MPGQSLAEDRGGAFLMRGIGVGMNEGDRDRLDVAAHEVRGDGAHGGFVEREPHHTFDVHALGNGEAQRARHQRRRLFEKHIVLVVAALVGDLDDVAEPFGRDQRGAGALALDDGVGRERGAVQEHADVRKAEARVGEDGARALDNGLLGRARASSAPSWSAGDRPPRARCR